MSRGNDLWDDPEWEALRKRISGQKPPKQKRKHHEPVVRQKPAVEPQNVSSEPKRVEVKLNLTVPHIPRPNLDRDKLLGLLRQHLRWIVIGGGSLAVILVTLIAFRLLGHKSARPTDGTGGKVGKGSNAAPFKTLLPSGKTEETSDNKVLYDPEKQVASFRDTIRNVNVVVSEQPLPEAFKQNTDEEVRKLAESFAARTVIRESPPKAYLGTSAKGPQTVIFTRNNLLVFIYSDGKLEQDEWSQYVAELL